MSSAIHRRLSLLAAPMLVVIAAGCFGSAHTRPPRNAESISPAALVGQWMGTYRAQSVDRDGKFRLVIEQHGDSLAGWLDLVGVPAEPGRAVVTARSSSGDSVRVGIPTITVDGVRARFRSASYWDPGCGCALRLDITGFMVADTLAGYYDAVGTALMATGDGRWRAVRVR